MASPIMTAELTSSNGQRRPQHVWSRLLSTRENMSLFNLLGHDCYSLGIAIVQLLQSRPPQHSEWDHVHSGVLCFVKDYVCRSYFFRLYSLEHGKLWEQEFHRGFNYQKLTDTFHCFESGQCMTALNFVDKTDANTFSYVVMKKIREKQEKMARKKERQDQRRIQDVPSMYNSLPTQGANQNTQVAFSAPGATVSQAGAYRRINKEDIGHPIRSTFQHRQHIGIDGVRFVQASNNGNEIPHPPGRRPPPLPKARVSEFNPKFATGIHRRAPKPPSESLRLAPRPSLAREDLKEAEDGEKPRPLIPPPPPVPPARKVQHVVYKSSGSDTRSDVVYANIDEPPRVPLRPPPPPPARANMPPPPPPPQSVETKIIIESSDVSAVNSPPQPPPPPPLPPSHSPSRPNTHNCLLNEIVKMDRRKLKPVSQQKTENSPPKGMDGLLAEIKNFKKGTLRSTIAPSDSRSSSSPSGLSPSPMEQQNSVVHQIREELERRRCLLETGNGLNTQSSNGDPNSMDGKSDLCGRGGTDETEDDDEDEWSTENVDAF
ncbi:hypothetical protein ACOME3_004802 [Neoechinorhynchus agilis]